MTYDMNDAQPQVSGELIPDGTYAKVAMHIRKGGVDGAGDLDKGLLKASNQPGSDVLSLDTEFTALEGPHTRRKFWQAFTVSGGKLDEEGQSIGWKISKSTFRAMIDSALGLDPDDMSEAAKAKRVLRGLSDLDGISFVAKIAVEPSRNTNYRDQNRLAHVVLPTAPEWQKVMNGEPVAAAPASKPRAPKPEAEKPAWGQGAPAAAKPAWGGALNGGGPAQAAAVPAQPAAVAQPTKPAPAWLTS
jgi:hypothetical protein